MKVAIVHDWLIGGGAERVVLELHKMYPEAPIYASYCTDEWREKLDGKVITGFLQSWPFSRLRKFIPFLRIWWFSRLKLDSYELVISSSGAEAKGIKTKALHINYCHAPTHYYWNRYDEYLKSPGFGFFDPLARLGLKLLVGPLRRWDYKAAQRPDYIVANSNFTKSEVKKYYGREAEVIHPPVDVEKFSNNLKRPRQGFLIAGRQTPYKRFDLAIAACKQLDLPLTVLGTGPDNKRLKKMAGPSINFVGWVTDDKRIKYFQSAEAFIFPGTDDFGITPVEALAAGTPLIAYKAGGALDYVNQATGVFFDKPSTEALAKTLNDFHTEKYQAEKLSAAATSFSPVIFRQKITDLVNEKRHKV